jgi:hypothetical protein
MNADHWLEFLSKSWTSLCINIYNLTPVESNSDMSKFRLSRIKVLVPRCRKPYYLHSWLKSLRKKINTRVSVHYYKFPNCIKASLFSCHILLLVWFLHGVVLFKWLSDQMLIVFMCFRNIVFIFVDVWLQKL